MSKPRAAAAERGQKLAEESLQQSAEQFRQLADNIREDFFILTPDYPPRMTYISPAYDEIWGRPRQELYERPEAWIASTHPEDRERVGASYAQCMQGIVSSVEYRIERPDGSIRWIDARSFPVRDAHGKFVRVVGIAEDITVRRDAVERLHDALAVAEQQARDTAKLSELLDILQSCQSAEEAYKIT